MNPRDMSWVDEGLCAQTDPDAWHPEGEGATLSPAKRICKRCPVRRPCLEFALAEGLIYDGVWGGLSPRERQAIYKERRASAAEEGSAA